ncbi:serine/threonine protein phosphatase [Rhabdochromatium marinum]|uniref:serine/threonine protein phosphatase n=1 Tax=Rhabdochromatium marinum TaxID=48729 RepID=UPI001906CF20|nr:serine/threonine protein phosphatase [Rhabdochromatium marinum]MBK1649321.1 serine/threonine protein phosphatase [Rhabdochromatium marinum]
MVDDCNGSKPSTSRRITSLPGLLLKPATEVRILRHTPVAHSVRFNQILVTGPPGAGKSTFIRHLGGWPEEGYIDLTQRGWWRAETLALRPREIHLGLPFVGCPQAMALFDDAWLCHSKTLLLDLARIQLPAPKRHLLAVDWLGRFVFEFMLPPPERIYADRCIRAREGTHPVDERIDLEQIRTQVAIYCAVFALFHRHGMQVYVRQRIKDRPLRLCDPPIGNQDAPA